MSKTRNYNSKNLLVVYTLKNSTSNKADSKNEKKKQSFEQMIEVIETFQKSPAPERSPSKTKFKKSSGVSDSRSKRKSKSKRWIKWTVS